MRGFAYDVVNAVLAAGADDVRDAIARAEALTAVRGSEDFAAVSAAFKRIKNILRQAEEKGFRPDEQQAASSQVTSARGDRPVGPIERAGSAGREAARAAKLWRGAGADCHAAADGRHSSSTR